MKYRVLIKDELWGSVVVEAESEEEAEEKALGDAADILWNEGDRYIHEIAPLVERPQQTKNHG